MSKYGPYGYGPAGYDLKRGADLSPEKFLIMHFVGKKGYDVLHMSRTNQAEPAMVLTYACAHPCSEYAWLELPQDNIDYQISSVKTEELPPIMSRKPHGGRYVPIVNTVTFLNGHQVKFGRISGGYHRQSKAYNDTNLAAYCGYDMAARLFTEHKEYIGPLSTLVGEHNQCEAAYAYDHNTSSNEGTILMNTNEMITIMQLEGGAKIVKARYLDDNRGAVAPYHFKNVIGLDLRADDLIACETRDTFAILQVLDPDCMATDVGCPLGDLKHVVAKLRNDEFERVKEAENNAVRELALSEVTSKLDTYRQQVGNGAFDTVAGLLGVDPSRNALADHGTAEVIDDDFQPMTPPSRPFDAELETKLNDDGTGV